MKRSTFRTFSTIEIGLFLSAYAKTIFTFLLMIYTVFIIQNQPTKHQSKALKININDFLYRPL